MLIAAGGHTVLSMEQKTTTKTKIMIFIIRKQNSSFGNSYYNLDFLKNYEKFGRVGCYAYTWRGNMNYLWIPPAVLTPPALPHHSARTWTVLTHPASQPLGALQATTHPALSTSCQTDNNTQPDLPTPKQT